jgi:3-phosphoshikimate 1-carboxyvinyltransferase
MKSLKGYGMKSITPSRIRGQLPAPPSKSMTVRALAAGLLSRGVSRIENVSLCDDGVTAAGIIEELGATVERQGKRFIIHGTGKDSLDSPKGILDCRESGLSMRMFAPVAALLSGETTLLASGSLRSRPMEMVEALRQLGVFVRTENGHAPIAVKGPMKGGSISIDASVSSQLLTGLLMALPLCETPSTIVVSNLKSSPYVSMTVRLLSAFGVRVDHDEGLHGFTVSGSQTFRPSTYTVEGDWSGASFLLVAGATAGEVTVTGIDPLSLQADRAILAVLGSAGARIVTGDDYVSVEARDLRPFRFDATSCPDLFPPLVALASSCPGQSQIQGVDRLTHKESDRAAALRAEFEKLGITIKTIGNAMEVYGGRISGGVVDSHDDHRIAMAAAVAGLRAAEKVIIQGSRCVAKSYPEFFTDLEGLQVTA